MDPIAATVIAFVVLLAFLACRVPVAIGLLASGALGLFLLRGFSFAEGTLGRLPYQTPSRYVLVVIPLFIAMGVFAKHGSLAEDAFAAAKPLLRKVPGGLGIATIASCAGFGAISGSSVATVASVGPIAVREMKSEGYQTSFAAGIVGAAGTLGVMIPPSIALVLYGIITGESIGLLLIAGIVPGLVTAAFYSVAIVGRVLVNPSVGGRTHRRGRSGAVTEHDSSPADVRASSGSGSTAVAVVPRLGLAQLLSLSRIVVLFLVVMGGIYLGVMTTSEAAAVGASLALLFLLYDAWRERPGIWRTVSSAFGEAISLTSMVFALLIGSAIFTLFIVTAGIPATFTTWATGLTLPAWLVVAVLLLAFVPLGMFLDPISMLLIGVPLTYPVVMALGYDGIWYGILIVKMVELALITPPVGLNPYVVAGSCEGVTVSQAFRGASWFFALELATIAMFFAFPGLVTWLPELVGSR
ncbi:MAG: TRAP transporter large permease [Mycobacteriales bacterium]